MSAVHGHSELVTGSVPQAGSPIESIFLLSRAARPSSAWAGLSVSQPRSASNVRTRTWGTRHQAPALRSDDGHCSKTFGKHAPALIERCRLVPEHSGPRGRSLKLCMRHRRLVLIYDAGFDNGTRPARCTLHG